MSWTKKHFLLTASVLRKELNTNENSEETIENLTDEFIEAFKQLNPNFNPSRFEEVVFDEEKK